MRQACNIIKDVSAKQISLDSQEEERNQVPDGKVDPDGVVELLPNNPVNGVCSPESYVREDMQQCLQTTYARPI